MKRFFLWGNLKIFIIQMHAPTSRRNAARAVVLSLMAAVAALTLFYDGTTRFFGFGGGERRGGDYVDVVGNAPLEEEEGANGLVVTESEPPRRKARVKARDRYYDPEVAREYVPETISNPDEYFIRCNSSGSSSLSSSSLSGFKDTSSLVYQFDPKKDVKHIVDAIHESSLNRDPFKSAYFCNILPQDLYDDINAYFPPAYALMKDQRANAGQVGRRDADKRYKCSAFDILKLRDEKKWSKVLRAKKVWERATKALYSPSVKLALFMKFKISKKPVSRDFRVQSDAGGFSIGTHPDNRKKILTFQLYLPQDANEESSVYTYGTCLHTPEQHRRRDKIDGSAPCEKKMAFVANSAYAFPVTRSSFHSVEKVVGKSKGARKTIMLNWYTHAMEGAQSMGGGLLSLLAG